VSTGLKGQSALVTGGSRGIGHAIARALVAEGANVAVVGRDEARLSAARHEISGSGPGKVETIRADVRHYEDIERAVSAAALRFGGLGVLVNCAGIGIFADVADMTPDQWEDVIDTNLTGVFFACHAALPHMRRRGAGYIVNISSLAGTNPFVHGAAYCASKAGLDAFSEALMQEVRYDNIRVSCIAPGSVATGFTGDPSRGTEWKIQPEDVGEIVVDLLKHPARSLASRVEMRPSRPRK
jgi:3-oxoacyl-[acyl-carrier protein] reductase